MTPVTMVWTVLALAVVPFLPGVPWMLIATGPATAVAAASALVQLAVALAGLQIDAARSLHAKARRSAVANVR